MRILFVAATESEIGALRPAGRIGLPEFDLLVTGAGMVATAFALGRHLELNKYDLAINLGIAGSFDRNIPLGEVVQVTEDHLSEFGAEDGERFLPIEELGFGQSAFFTPARLSSYVPGEVRKVSAITVNTVHGHPPSIEKLRGRMQPSLESMEGAAFFYACSQAGQPCLQIRAVSNYVEKRNRQGWQIGLAIENLNSFALEFLRSVSR